MSQVIVVDKLSAKTLKQIPKGEKRYLLYFTSEELSPNIMNKLDREFIPVCLNRYIENEDFIYFTNTYYHNLGIAEKESLLKKLETIPFAVFYADLISDKERSRDLDLSRRLTYIFKLDTPFLYYYPTVLFHKRYITCTDDVTIAE